MSDMNNIYSVAAGAGGSPSKKVAPPLDGSNPNQNNAAAETSYGDFGLSGF